MSRRWRYPRSRRGIFYQVVKTQAAATAPPYVPSFQEPAGRNSRPRITRRGQFFQSPPTAVMQALSSIPAILEPAGRNSRPRITRRGKFYDVPPAAVAATPPAWVPAFLNARRAPVRPVRRGEYLIVPPSVQSSVQFGRSRRVSAPLARHGRFYAVPPLALTTGPGPLTPSVLRPSTRRVAAPRRGQFFSIPKVGATPTPPPPFPPQFTRPRVRVAFVRRGEFFTIPLAGAAPVPSVALPQMLRSRVRVLFARRGRFWAQPFPQQVVSAPSWVPQIARTRRPQVGPVRRGEFLSVPLPRATCPLPMRSRRCSLPAVRRGRVFGPTWVYVPPAPPTSGTASAATGPVPTASAATGLTASASAAVMTVPTASGG